MSAHAPVATELWRLPAGELARLIAARQASSREVVEAHLRRIGEVNPRVNAITALLSDEALAAADAADRTIADGTPTGALHGVPFTVKENVDLAGLATTLGLRALDGAMPAQDAPVVRRLRAAGGIPLGHTNCPTLTLRWHTDSELWGATVNPWDASVTPGASSGGEAAALATGMSPLGLGNDGLGSLRWPAQCCGIAVLKPTLGRIPHASSIEGVPSAIGAQLTTVQGPMARRVADLRAAFAVLAGPDRRDPWSLPAPLAGPEVPRPIRVAVVSSPCGDRVAPQVGEGLARAADALADAGYVVEEVEPPSIDLAARTLLLMLSTPDVHVMWQEAGAMLPEETHRFLRDFYEAAGDIDPVATLGAFGTRHSLLAAWSEFLEDHPLILGPISTEPPFAAGQDLAPGAVAATIRSLRLTMAANALGLPAVALPVGIGAGLPQAVQLIGPRYREDLCLDAAQALEERLGIITPIDPR
jgi:amidase